MKTHEIKVKTYLNSTTGKWEIRVTGVSSGVEINGGDGDNMDILFYLDASRFKPLIKLGE